MSEEVTKENTVWMSYQDYVANKFWMDGLVNLHWDYGQYIPEEERIKLGEQLEKLMEKLKSIEINNK